MILIAHVCIKTLFLACEQHYLFLILWNTHVWKCVIPSSLIPLLTTNKFSHRTSKISKFFLSKFITNVPRVPMFPLPPAVCDYCWHEPYATTKATKQIWMASWVVRRKRTNSMNVLFFFLLINSSFIRHTLFRSFVHHYPQNLIK